MTEPQTQTPYRRSEPQDEAEPTKTVSDWEAFLRGIGPLLSPIALLAGVFCLGFWVAVIGSAVDALRAFWFAAVKRGHRRMGVENDRKFSRLMGGEHSAISRIAEQCGWRASVVEDMAVGSFICSFPLWGGVLGGAAGTVLGGDAVLWAVLGALLSMPLFLAGLGLAGVLNDLK